MKKQFAIGIIFLLIVSVLTPIVIGYNINISNKEILQSTSPSGGGLMNSSWPMFGQNTRHTGLSPYGKSGTWYVEKWNYDFEDTLMFSSPAIDENGTIYLGTNDNHFYAINSDGTLKWQYKTGGAVKSSPAIAEEGTIYVGSNDGKLYAFNPDGTKKWSTGIGSSWVSSSPVIDEEGIIYVAEADGRICAVYPNGTKKWDYMTGSDVHCSPVLDNLGTVYCGSNDGYTHALYTNNGTQKWRYGTGTSCGGAGATVGENGTIYFGDLLGYLHAVNPNGTRKWRKDLLYNVYTSPAITEEGNIIVGNYDGYIYSFNPDNGAENWKFYVEEWEWLPCSPVIDKFGIIYFGANNGWFYALNPDGTLRWSFKALDEFFGSPAISEDGTIYVGSHGHLSAKLYALEPVEGNSPPEVPNIDGPKNVNLIFKFTYTFDTTDPDGDDVSFFIQWDRVSSDGWTEYVPSGTSIELRHRFLLIGSGVDYAVMKVKARDEHGAWSDWARYRVNFGFSRNIEINSLFLQFLERFPLFTYFRNILKG